MSRRSRFSSICYVHGPDVGMIVMMTLGALIEFVGAFTVGAENYLGVLFFHAGLLFSGVAMFTAYGIWVQERRWSQRFSGARLG
jgi:hypothetical protein